MTSNLGSEQILENQEEEVMNTLKMYFKPEFLNRIDEIILFKALSKEIVYEILDKIINEIETRLKNKRIHILLTNEAREKVIKESYDEVYGARPVRRYVAKNIETLLAQSILEDKIKMDSLVTIDVDKEQFIIK